MSKVEAVSDWKWADSSILIPSQILDTAYNESSTQGVEARDGDVCSLEALLFFLDIYIANCRY
jgi:hypothetical protein